MYKPDWFFLPFFISWQVILKKHTFFLLWESLNHWMMWRRKIEEIKVFYVVMNLSGSLFVVSPFRPNNFEGFVDKLRFSRDDFWGIWIASHRKKGFQEQEILEDDTNYRRYFRFARKACVRVNTLSKFQIGLLTNLDWLAKIHAALSTCLFDYVKQAWKL